MRAILIDIEAGPVNCGECEHLNMFSTGIAGEWHKRCTVFYVNGNWRNDNMPRPAECLKAEQRAKEMKHG